MLIPGATSAHKPARAWLRAGGLACACLLAACASLHTAIPDLPKDTPANWQARNSAAGGHAPDLDHWWRAFDDPVLNALIERALKDNLNIQIAGERLQAARAARHAKRGMFWPNLNFRTYVETTPNASTGFLEVGLDSTWEFGFFGRATGNKRMNLADENLAIIDDAAMRVSVIAEVTRNYVELRAAQARAKVLDETVAVRRKQVELAQKRVATRLGTQIELDRAQTELLQAQNEAAEPALTVMQTQQALAVLFGTTAPDPALLTAAIQPALPAIDFHQTPADLVRTRPDIRRAEQNIVRAAGELGIARADLWPKLGIYSTFVSSTALTSTHLNDDFVFIAGPTISLPILDWSARRQVVNARERALQASVLAYREAVIEGVAEAQTALAQFDAKSALMENAQKTLALDERGAQSARTLQRIGLGDGLETAGADLAAAQALLARNLAVRDRALAYIALYKAFGGAIPPLAKDTKSEGSP
ncbi:MAG: TolC family protein [Proteobacteria bacterium]|uniref:TolC family protein n=1 Tax=Rudaea sp. TaxID=2136325 RepID=UPI00321F6A29|nr:TolC family protein [Pseudomonadota bacterium]